MRPRRAVHQSGLAVITPAVPRLRDRASNVVHCCRYRIPLVARSPRIHLTPYPVR